MNGDLWRVKFVHPYSPKLVDRTQNYRVATTDPSTRCIYLSKDLNGDFLNRVLIHELGHATMVSYDLLQIIHQMVYPEYWMEMEEWICNFIADYGLQIFRHVYEILGERAWVYVPQELERLVA